jgi:hypothetical protein
MKASSERPPSYRTGSVEPFLKNLMVGYEETPCSVARAFAFSASASTLAIRTLGSLTKSLARVSQIGARVLQSASVLATCFYPLPSGITYVRTRAQ